jgi:hypothetical protein
MRAPPPSRAAPRILTTPEYTSYTLKLPASLDASSSAVWHAGDSDEKSPHAAVSLFHVGSDTIRFSRSCRMDR